MLTAGMVPCSDSASQIRDPFVSIAVDILLEFLFEFSLILLLNVVILVNGQIFNHYLYLAS